MSEIEQICGFIFQGIVTFINNFKYFQSYNVCYIEHFPAEG